jgi:phosphoserine phosphatase RsbU/P
MEDSILVVDDDPVIRTILSALLETAGYRVVAVSGGPQALEAAKSGRCDLVILDINMPNMDGFEVCTELKSDPTTVNIPIIFLTAAGDIEWKVKGLDLGAADYITKSFDREELLARVRTQLRIQHLMKQLNRMNNELRAKEAKLEDDLKSAAIIQYSLLPQSFPMVKEVGISWKFLPCDTVAGDLFNVFQLDDDHLGFYLLDVSGHGVPAAMVTVSASQFLHPGAGGLIDPGPGKSLRSPQHVLTRLDETYPIERFGKYFTIVYGILNTKNGACTYSNAGHPFPLLLSRDGEITTLEAGGPILGMGAVLPFEQETVFLRPGDKLLLYTDGIVDQRNKEDERCGEDRFYHWLTQSVALRGEATLERLSERLIKFSESRELEDDVSLLCFEYLGPREK